MDLQLFLRKNQDSYPQKYDWHLVGSLLGHALNVAENVKIRKIHGEKCRIVHKSSTIIKNMRWIRKNSQYKVGGYLVNKHKSYQHFVCG